MVNGFSPLFTRVLMVVIEKWCAQSAVLLIWNSTSMKLLISYFQLLKSCGTVWCMQLYNFDSKVKNQWDC